MRWKLLLRGKPFATIDFARANHYSHLLLSERDFVRVSLNREKLFEELNLEWKKYGSNERRGYCMDGLEVLRSDYEVEMSCPIERGGFKTVEIPIQYQKWLGEIKLKVKPGLSIFMNISRDQFIGQLLEV